MHLKRNNMPKIWPLKRKGTKYIVRPYSLENSVPLLVVMRDILGLTQNKKELKKVLNYEEIKINNKRVKDVKHPLFLFDVLSFKNKNYKVVLKNKKIGLDEVSDKEAKEKISKIIGKKVLKKGKIQLNLMDGRNYIISKKAKVGDSARIDFEKKNIVEIIPLKEKSKVYFISGSHVGHVGSIEKIGEDKEIVAKVDDEKITTKSESLIVIG